MLCPVSDNNPIDENKTRRPQQSRKSWIFPFEMHPAVISMISVCTIASLLSWYAWKKQEFTLKPGAVCTINKIVAEKHFLLIIAPVFLTNLAFLIGYSQHGLGFNLSKSRLKKVRIWNIHICKTVSFPLFHTDNFLAQNYVLEEKQMTFNLVSNQLDLSPH